MKESEIKERIATFLRRTAKTVVLPAAMGLGLGLGCGGDRTVKVDDGGTHAEAGQVYPAYATPHPRPEPPGPQPKYAAPAPEPPPVPPVQPDYAAPFPEPEPSDAGPAEDAFENVLLYGTPFPPPDGFAPPDGSAP